MKTLIPIFFLIFCCTATLLGQRIPPVKPVIVKLTSTECNVCGLRAWDEFKDVIDIYEKEAVIMAVHPLEESLLFTNTAFSFADNLTGFFGTPQLYINEENHLGAWLAGIRAYIEPFQEKQVVVHPFVEYIIADNQLKVEVKTQFFRATNRPHFLSVYAVEDQVSAEQVSRGPEEKHSKVLRTHLGENAMGSLFSEDRIEVNQEFINKYSINIDSTWVASHLEIAAIIWEKRGETYFVVNSNIALEPSSMLTNINELEAANVAVKLQPTILEEISTIQLDLPVAQHNLNLSVINAIGQQVKSIFSGDLQRGQYTFELNKNDYTNTGLYFIVLEKNGAKLVEKMVVR